LLLLGVFCSTVNMLRPATPLTVLLGIAFALLLLSVLSAPIISAIPLGSSQDVQFGVFGFCRPSGCSSVGIGYDIGENTHHYMTPCLCP
jgi:hypothetical protein